ncbi:MAG: sugar phosphate isomerase/epimerase [Trueperaceae bacterium]|nr:sugar phosphate isomerase/epimerase [Trueperaceae bacterium]MDZ7705855.1 sugar phosphate isomerase/epimerase [Trueperaceae bacterium]
MTPLRLLFSTGSLYPLDTAQCFELAAAVADDPHLDAGFDGIEVMCDNRYSTRDPAYLLELSSRYNLPILVLHTPFGNRVSGWSGRGAIAMIEQTLELAEYLDAETIVVHLPLWLTRARFSSPQLRFSLPWWQPSGPLRRWLTQTLPTLQQQTPVHIAIENMPARKVWGRTLNPAWYNSVAAWSRVHDRLTLDTTHWATFGVNPLEPLAQAGDRVAHIHLSNFDGREHRLPHRGLLDLGRFVQTLAETDYAGTVSLELHPDALKLGERSALQQNLRDSVAFCRRHSRTKPAS